MSVAVTNRERGVPFSIYLRPDGALERALALGRLLEAVREGGQLWVDVDATDPHQHALLEKVFGFHHLAIEDTLSPRTRVKLEDYPDYLFLVFKSVRLDEATADPYDLEVFNLYCFLGRSYLVTVHSLPSRGIREVQERIERSPDLLRRGVEMTLHAVLDVTVDEFLPLVDQVDALVDDLEARVIARYDEKAVQEIFSVKQLVVQLRRHLAPLREVLNVLTNRPHVCIEPAAQVYFRDVYDHTIRIVESVDSFRELLATVLDTYLTQMSNRMNQVMKSLSAVATIALPLVVVSGIFGMNFDGIPLLHHPWGFFWALGTMALISVVMIWFLRKKGWV